MKDSAPGMLTIKLALSLLLIASSAAAQERPNIILIIADDVSWNDIGAYGHPTVRTPTLDSMAANGLRLDNAYLTASSCSPSRSSIITGRYPHNTDAEQLHWPLPGEQITFSEKLREAGYWTGAAGKWHLGDEVRDRFDVVYENSLSNPEHYARDPAGTEDWVRLLNERPKDQPFFFWMASWDAHRPFAESIIENPHTQDDVTLPPYYPQTELYLNDFALYLDEITRLDLEVGKVMDTLEQQGQLENTLVIFIADNGRPYARDKTTLYDSGVKTPFIAHWPRQIGPGAVSNAIVSSIDIAPTILEMAEAEIPASIEGRSLLSLLKRPSDEFREYAASERNWHDFDDHGRTVRTARFRYIRNSYIDLPATPSGDTVYHETWHELVRLHEQGALTEQMQRPFRTPRPREELYDLETDRFELTNLAGDPEFAEELESHRAMLDEWIESSNDFIPSVRTPDDFDRETGVHTPARIRPRPSKKEMYGKSGSY